MLIFCFTFTLQTWHQTQDEKEGQVPHAARVHHAAPQGQSFLPVSTGGKSYPLHSTQDQIWNRMGLRIFIPNHCQLQSIPSHPHFSLNAYILLYLDCTNVVLSSFVTKWKFNLLLILIASSFPLALLSPSLAFHSQLYFLFYSLFTVLSSILCIVCAFLGEWLVLKANS